VMPGNKQLPSGCRTQVQDAAKTSGALCTSAAAVPRHSTGTLACLTCSTSSSVAWGLALGSPPPRKPPRKLLCAALVRSLGRAPRLGCQSRWIRGGGSMGRLIIVVSKTFLLQKRCCLLSANLKRPCSSLGLRHLASRQMRTMEQAWQPWRSHPQRPARGLQWRQWRAASSSTCSSNLGETTTRNPPWPDGPLPGNHNPGWVKVARHLL
jgi:hypothetical protein